jgi:hypothetical protein
VAAAAVAQAAPGRGPPPDALLPPTEAALVLVQAAEAAEGVAPTTATRAMLFGPWHLVLERLVVDATGATLGDVAARLREVTLATVAPATLAARLGRLGWTTTRRRGERVLVRRGQ